MHVFNNTAIFCSSSSSSSGGGGGSGRLRRCLATQINYAAASST